MSKELAVRESVPITEFEILKEKHDSLLREHEDLKKKQREAVLVKEEVEKWEKKYVELQKNLDKLEKDLKDLSKCDDDSRTATPAEGVSSVVTMKEAKKKAVEDTVTCRTKIKSPFFCDQDSRT